MPQVDLPAHEGSGLDLIDEPLGNRILEVSDKAEASTSP
jgi:hypothetical protein